MSSNVHELFPEDEQARLAGEAFRKQAAKLIEHGFDADSVLSGMLGSALQEMIDRDGVEDTALWCLGIYGRLNGVPAEPQESH